MTSANARGARSLTKSLVFLIAAVIAASATSAQNVAAQDCVAGITWIRQFGTAADDKAFATAMDASNNVYVAGNTAGTLAGQISAGGRDAFVRKYDLAGTELWSRQFGTTGDDFAWDVAVDQTSGSVYVAGELGLGFRQGYLRKYDSYGGLVWMHQAGVVSHSQGVAVDTEGNVFVAGVIGSGAFSDAVVRKYDSGGNLLWARTFGSPTADLVANIVTDGNGNAYVVGSTPGALPGQTSSGDSDAFVRAYDPAGNELWTRQFGTTGIDTVRGVGVDQDANVFVSGQTDGTLPNQTSAGSFDVYVRKYDSAGTEVWTRQFGTPTDCFGCFGFDQGFGLTADGDGNVYLTGSVGGPLPGETLSGGGDAFIRKYNPAGGVVWTRQFGSPFSDYTTDIAGHDDGKLYASGFTFGTLAGQTSAGDWDAFAAEITHDAEPPSLTVALSSNMLWPPDHRMNQIAASIEVSDACDSSPIVTLVSLASNEPDNGDDDGDTVNDIQIVDPNMFLLRAERSGTGIGRIYTATYVATDASGNRSDPVSVTLTVPLTNK